MGTVTAIEQVEQIRRELRELDLKNSSCPVDRRRLEKENERKAQEAREAQEKQHAANWWAALDARVVQIIELYCWGKQVGGSKRAVVRGIVAEALAENHKEIDKQIDKQLEQERCHFETRIAELEARLKAIPGKLPVVKAWRPEAVTYASEMVAHNGATYQARRDTAQRPPGADWVVVARAGRDAITPSLRGTFDTHECYAQFDVVEFDGASYIARSDDPGIPGHGEGWQVIGSERMDRRAEVKTAIEDERQALAAKLVELEQASNERWTAIDQHIDRARESILQSTGEAFGQFRAELKEFKPTLEEKERVFDAKLAALEERLKSVPGKLPVVKSSWQPESVIYQAEMVAHNGALYQARKDTVQTPGGSDWVCVARHGRDAITPVVRGAFNVNDSYTALDIVSFDGAGYIAKTDAPGLCPGDGWEPLSSRGQRGRKGESITGPRGEKGVKGDPGNDAQEIVDWHIDPVNYRAIPFMNNGKPGKELNLRPLFERFLEEVGAT
jgi:syndecan 1/collagen type XXI alpha/collagen type V/XI/XXIV/XXVII alpha